MCGITQRSKGVPVTARLSQAFYERLGEQVTNELVGWFNDVDATYRNDLKELNELNFSRFDAKVEQRFAQHEARWETKFAAFELKMEQRFAAMDAKWETRFAQLETSIDQRFAAAEVRMEQRFAEQTRWMFGTVFAAWVTLMIPLISLLLKR